MANSGRNDKVHGSEFFSAEYHFGTGKKKGKCDSNRIKGKDKKNAWRIWRAAWQACLASGSLKKGKQKTLADFLSDTNEWDHRKDKFVIPLGCCLVLNHILIYYYSKHGKVRKGTCTRHKRQAQWGSETDASHHTAGEAELVADTVFTEFSSSLATSWILERILREIYAKRVIQGGLDKELELAGIQAAEGYVWDWKKLIWSITRRQGRP